jgi:hypothetical protein
MPKNNQKRFSMLASKATLEDVVPDAIRDVDVQIRGL